MSKKPHKIEETTTPYVTKKLAAKNITPKFPASKADDAAFKKVADKIFSERKELLHKLAQ